MSFQKTIGIKKIESDFIFVFVGQRFFQRHNKRFKHADSDSDSDTIQLS